MGSNPTLCTTQALAVTFIVAATIFGFGSALAIGSLQARLGEASRCSNSQACMTPCYPHIRIKRPITECSCRYHAAGLYVGIIYNGQLQGIYFISGSVFIVVGVVLLIVLTENYGATKKQTVAIKESTSYCVKSKHLLSITYIIATIYAAYMAFLFTWQPRATSMGIEDTSLGLVYSFSCQQYLPAHLFTDASL